MKFTKRQVLALEELSSVLLNVVPLLENKSKASVYLLNFLAKLLEKNKVNFLTDSLTHGFGKVLNVSKILDEKQQTVLERLDHYYENEKERVSLKDEMYEAQENHGILDGEATRYESKYWDAVKRIDEYDESKVYFEKHMYLEQEKSQQLEEKYWQMRKDLEREIKQAKEMAVDFEQKFWQATKDKDRADEERVNFEKEMYAKQEQRDGCDAERVEYEKRYWESEKKSEALKKEHELYYNSMKKQLDTLSPKDKKFLMERVLEEDILKRLKELEK